VSYIGGQITLISSSCVGFLLTPIY